MCKEPINGEEYAPITQGLREYIERHPTMMHAVGLTDVCDNIDAIHKSLEEQNAKLREKVLNQRKQLAEVQEAIERRNNCVLKRRWQKKMDALKNENEEMRNFNCRVREAIRRHEDLTLWGADYTALPLDADGEWRKLADGGVVPESCIRIEEEGSICPAPKVNVTFEGQKLTFDAAESKEFLQLVSAHFRRLAGIEVPS